MASNRAQEADRHRSRGMEAAAAAEELRRLLADSLVPAVRHELVGLAAQFRRRAADHFQRAEEMMAQSNATNRQRRERRNGGNHESAVSRPINR